MVIKVRFPRKFWFFVWLCKFFFFFGSFCVFDRWERVGLWIEFLIRMELLCFGLMVCVWLPRKRWIWRIEVLFMERENWSFILLRSESTLFFFKERNGWEFDFSFCFVWSLKIRDDTDSFLKNYWLLRKCWKSVQFEEL